METQSVLALISAIREKSNKIIIEELKKHNIEGLAPSHGAILIQLYRNDNLRMKDIAQRVGKDKSTVTALVNKLMKLGYLYKIRDADDSRISHLKLTEKGLAIEDSFYSISENMVERIYTGFCDEDKETLMSHLTKILANL